MIATSYELVAPTEVDVDDMAHLLASYWHEVRESRGTEQTVYEEDFKKQQAEVSDLVEASERSHVRVMRARGRIWGLLSGHMGDFQFSGATIDSFVVHPDYRGQGLGTTLLSDFVAGVPADLPISVVPLSTSEYQAQLEAFYQRFGFDWYPHDEDYMYLIRGGGQDEV